MIYIDKENFFNYSDPFCATFSIVQFENHNLIEAITVAHIFNEQPSDDYEKVIFLSFNENDSFEHFEK